MRAAYKELATLASLKEAEGRFVEEPERSRLYFETRRRVDTFKTALETADKETRQRYTRTLFEHEVCLNMLSFGEYLYFGGGVKAPELYLSAPKLSGTPVYEAVSLDVLRRMVRACSPVPLLANQVDSILGTFMDLPDPNQKIGRRIIAIADGLYWDRETSSFLSEARPYKCFYRLFDTEEEEKNVPRFAPSVFDKKFSKEVETAYNALGRVLAALPDQQFPKDPGQMPDGAPALPYDFPFILAWADGDKGLYWDLMKVIAATFLKKRPDVAFFLTGSGFNGKSQFVGLLHTIFGARNTSKVALSEIGDSHLTHSLRFSILNAPDDEGGDGKKDINSYTKVFKQVASHETLLLPVMFSNHPIELKADFISVFPMNIFPRWKGEDTSALTRRTLLLPFTHDFREESKKYANFAKETYTPEVMARLVGQALALARFYRDKPLDFSSTVDQYREQMELENDTTRVYRILFEKYFDGFQTKKLLYSDYRNWCLAGDVGSIDTIASFRTEWNKYLVSGHKMRASFIGVDGQTKRPWGYRIPREAPGYHTLYSDYPLGDLGVENPAYYGGTIGRAIDAGFSVVSILESQIREKRS